MSRDEEEMIRRQSAVDQDDDDGDDLTSAVRDQLEIQQLRRLQSADRQLQRQLDDALLRFEEALAPPSVSLSSGPFLEKGTEEPVFDKDLRIQGAKPGDRIALEGKNLFGVTDVSIGGVPVVDLAVVNSQLIEFTVPSGVRSGDIEVTYTPYRPRRPRPLGNLNLTVVDVSASGRSVQVQQSSGE
jgi:hypothetical protein